MRAAASAERLEREVARLERRVRGRTESLARQFDRVLDQNANPIRYVRPVDAKLAVQTTNELGTIAVVQGEYPKDVTPSPGSRSYPFSGGSNGLGRCRISTDDTNNVSPILTIP